jgi:2-keto-4-pentenoate hydratase/2-oxohepta-3-ene-1,7-dioic acid hydratase in catechol pathway
VQLLTYKTDTGHFRGGARLGTDIYDLEALIGRHECATIIGMLEGWEVFEQLLLDRVADDAHAGLTPIKIAALAPPVLYPGAIYCAAANYRDHMHAMAVKLNQPDEPDPRDLDINPYHFVIPAKTCLSGPDEPLRIPWFGKNIDWEIELVAVIGKTARQVSVERALDYVAGYTIGNDVSVRDHRYLKIPNVPAQSLFRSDFVAMKGFDKSCIIGPWLTLSRDIPDPQNLAMKLWIDDELMQDSSTSEMVFSTAEQISYLSQRVTLHPGDLIMTGTPAGTGMEIDRFLRAGETLRLQIEGIGEMMHEVVA